MKMSIVDIIGYSGLELVRLLNDHKNVMITPIHATKGIDRRLSGLYPYPVGVCDLVIEAFNAREITTKSDLVFLAIPDGAADQLVQPFAEVDFPVIDLSDDHRLSAGSYEKWYKKTSASGDMLDRLTYVLAESTDVKGKKFTSNPGCYATATELALIPSLKAGVVEEDSITVDAKSGLTGAGKALSESSHLANVYDNYVTYKLNRHQHTPGIVQELQLFSKKLHHIQFSTSLLPVSRGIMATSYVRLKRPLSETELYAIYKDAYKDKPLVRIQNDLPELHNIIGSSFTDVGFLYSDVTNVLTVVSVIDSSIKGAAGQAVQNLNLMNGWNEAEDLSISPNYLQRWKGSSTEGYQEVRVPYVLRAQENESD